MGPFGVTKSEFDLSAGDDDLFIGTVAVGGSIGEGRLLVVKHEFHVGCEIPVDPDSDGVSGGSGFLEISVTRVEGLVIDRQLAVAEREFDGTPVALGGIVRPERFDAFQ